MSDILSTLEYLIKGIVIDDSQVKITSQENNGFLTLTVTAPENIVGQIIGKEGKIVKSVRAILNLCYPNQRYLLEINPSAPVTPAE